METTIFLDNLGRHVLEHQIILELAAPRDNISVVVLFTVTRRRASFNQITPLSPVSPL